MAALDQFCWSMQNSSESSESCNMCRQQVAQTRPLPLDFTPSSSGFPSWLEQGLPSFLSFPSFLSSPSAKIARVFGMHRGKEGVHPDPTLSDPTRYNATPNLHSDHNWFESTGVAYSIDAFSVSFGTLHPGLCRFPTYTRIICHQDLSDIFMATDMHVPY